MKKVLFFLALLLTTMGMSIIPDKKSTDGPVNDKDTPEANKVKPAPRQLAYQQMELIGFAHFTVNTFTDKEWGDGTESPRIFNPTAFDAKQWVKACTDAGIKELILTAKHHDGFCLWPSQYTEHSVKSSPWKGGKGDVVKEVADACRQAGIKFGIYLSPWDRHEPSYGTAAYNTYYKNQLRELLTNYGEISEVWMDGAKGENAKDMEYDFEGWRSLIRELQPNAVIFSDAGPDVRWIGNEKGIAGETNWSMLDKSKVTIGKADPAYLNTGDPNGPDWVPGECDVSIRPGWFYHAKEDNQVKSIEQLLEIYYGSVGRNGVLLLNIPPDRRGLFHENDVKRLKEFRAIIDETFKNNLVKGKKAKATNQRNEKFSPAATTDGDATTYWATADGIKSASVTIDLQSPVLFDRIMLQEPIKMGQRIAAFTVEARINGQWKEVAIGTTIGYKRLLKIKPTQADQVRVTIQKANNTPLLAEFGIFKASDKEKVDL